MARVGVSITKSCSFRGSTQEFSNVYYYEIDGLPDATEAEGLIDNIVQIEKSFHSVQVTFVRGRCWSAGGTESQNNMIVQKNLTGTGARTLVSGMDKERAFLVRLRAGNDSRGNPVYLRKWFHACGNFYSGQAVSSGQLEQTTALSPTEKTNIQNAVNPLKSVAVGLSVYILQSKSGRNFSVGADFVSHNWIEHHQLGDMWRAQ